MKKIAERLAGYTITQLNKIAKGNKGIVSIEYDKSIYVLEYFTLLKIGEDYFDEEEEAEGFSGLNAYVEETPYRIPFESITRVFVAWQVKVK